MGGDKVYKWEITPHPYDASLDVMVTDDDIEAFDAIQRVAEMFLWDSIDPGQERILKVKCNHD